MDLFDALLANIEAVCDGRDYSTWSYAESVGWCAWSRLAAEGCWY